MDFEVTIVGAGVVGSSLASLLAQQGINVCVLDRNDPFRGNKVTRFQGRTVALNLSSVELIKELNLWSELEKETTSFERICVWDTKGSSPLEFLATDIDQKKLGYVASINSILEYLFKLMQDSENVSLQLNTELKGVEVNGNSVTISCSNGNKISSKLLVGADGINSTLRQLSNINTRTWNYDQKAFVTSLKTEKFHENTAWQIFTPTGPIAFLPFDVNKESNISLVWSAEKKYAEELNAVEEEKFISELENKTEYILGRIELKGAISSFPLNQLHSKSYFSNRVVLVGDAAHSFHPLAGQGLNLGFSDVVSLTDKLTKARRRGKDLGSNEILQDYEKSRKIPNLTMTAMMELFKQGFEHSDPWIKLSRNLVFSTVNQSSWLKKKFIKEAAGFI